jgi:hypothetical protein
MRVEAKSETPKLTIEYITGPDSPKVKDETLVAEAVRGSSAAFETLFQR